MKPRFIILLLAAACLVLGFAAAVATFAARRAQIENLCWRDFIKDGERPPEGDCERL